MADWPLSRVRAGSERILKGFSELKSVSKLSGELSCLRDFFAYNTYVRRKYLELLTKLPKKTLVKERGASFPSLLDIFVHVLDVYRCWFHAYETGESCSRWQHANKTGELIPPELRGLSLAKVKKMARQVDRWIETFMQQLAPKDLAKSFQFAQGTRNDKRVSRRNVADMLWHLVEEELQHRGEMNALLWQEDIEPPVTSWFGWRKAPKKEM